MAADPNLGTRIKRARERKRWTQQQLAGALGVNIKTVDNWENGRTSPRSSIGALEDVLGISLDGDEAEPLHISADLRQRIARLTDDERAWVLEELRREEERRANAPSEDPVSAREREAG
jgi:transcriptional regulator with XRE-family HTH domain